MPSNLTGPATVLFSVYGDPNEPALYFISNADFATFQADFGADVTMDYYDNTGTYVASITLQNTDNYGHGPVNLPVSIDATGIYHEVIMSTGQWNVSSADLITINDAVSAAGGPIGLVETEGAVPMGLQTNYPTYTNGVTLVGVQPQTCNLAQVCNIIPNQSTL